ncbi:putative transcription factor Nin-like family [Helianthus annuus]|nr:putative transcription factor Nin-like family [Helianthus annuus]
MLMSCDVFYVQVLNECRKNDSDKIYGILKTACDIHGLPLAQTWAVSEHSSFVSHEKVIQKSCGSFDTRCVGKVCMSRAALPFFKTWACGLSRKRVENDTWTGPVAMLARRCYPVYPLVHNARSTVSKSMSGLTSCFAIFLHSVEVNDDYVLEFFLPPDIKDCGDVQNLVQTLKQKIEIASGFELGDSSRIQVVGPPTNIGRSLSIDAHTIQISSITTTKNDKFETVTSDSESIMENIANKTESSAIVSNQCPPKQIHPDKFSDIITGTENNINVVGARKNNDMISYPSVSMQKTSDKITDAGEKNNRLKQGRKRKIDSLTMEAVETHVEKPIDEAAKSLGGNTSFCHFICYDNIRPNLFSFSVSRSTLKRFCREQNLQRHSNKRFRFAFVVFLMVKVKRWSCSIKSHGVSGKWWSCGRHSYLPSKSDFIYQAASLFVLLRRWKNKNSMRNTLRSVDHPSVIESTTKPKYTINITNPYSCVAESTLVHASPKQTVTNISNIKMVTVKATFNADMIKFQFPTSSGLLELEHEVARRIKLKSRRPRLKYRDEDNDLILLACDADLHHLLGFAANHSPIRLVIVADD